MITIIFRFDDYSALSNTKLENQILTTFKENNSTLTIGVIPFVCEGNKEKICKQESIPLLENKLDILKKGINKGYIDVALHGNTHQTIKEFPRSEFLGLNYEQQFTKIESGKLFLEEKLGTNINTFIPPWNRYDLNTLKVLEKLQYSTISAGTKCVANPDSKLNFLPNTCFIKDIELAIREAEQANCNHPIIVVLMHETDFKEINSLQGIIDIPLLNKLINSLKLKHNIQLLSISQAIDKIPKLNVNRYQYYRKIRNLSNLLPALIAYNERNSKLLAHRNQMLAIWMKICIFLFLKISLMPFLISYYLSNLLVINYPYILIMTMLVNFFIIISFLYSIIIKDKIYRKWVYLTFILIGVLSGYLLHVILN